MTRHPQVAVSVVIATRDRPDVLARVLQSLITSVRKPREIVVADQSKGTESAEIVRRHASGDVDITYVPDDREGLGIAQNRALSHARCAVIAVTDDDCVPTQNWIAVIHDRFDSDRELSALTGPVIPLSTADPNLVPVSSRMSPLEQVFVGKNVPWEIGSGNNFAVRREWLDLVLGNDERLGPGSPGEGAVDMDLFYRLLRVGARIRYDPACVVFHERATPEQRLERRGPYGHGMGAAIAIWLRERDLYALWILARWVAHRNRRLFGGLVRRDWRAVHEEALVLWGTGRGLVFGARVEGERLTSYRPPAAK